MLHMKPGAEPYYITLLDELENVTPDCLDDDRYVADRGQINTGDKTEMAAICSACPLVKACATYATAAKPPAGWWPGHNLIKTRKEAA